MSNLAALIDLVELDLRDTGNAKWSTAQITGQLRRALRDWNRTSPRILVASLSSTADTYEYSLSTLTNPMEIIAVWHPYDSTDEQDPPNHIKYRVISDAVLYIEPKSAPTGAATDKIRVFYSSPHTIEDLDSAAATTLDAQGEGIVVLGATAYCALSYAQSLIGTVTVSGWTPRHWQEWANARLDRYRDQLEEIRRRLIIQIDGRTAWAEEDRQTGRGGEV